MTKKEKEGQKDMVLVLLAEGFEEIEALTQVDYLRRAGLSVKTLGIGGRFITGNHGITVTAEQELQPSTLFDGQVQAVILPGGVPGVPNLAAEPAVAQLLRTQYAAGAWLAAICAAPSILAEQGFLHCGKATCFPGWEKSFPAGVQYTAAAVEVQPEARLITGRSAGVAGSFAVEIVRALCGAEKAAALKQSLHTDW